MIERPQGAAARGLAGMCTDVNWDVIILVRMCTCNSARAYAHVSLCKHSNSHWINVKLMYMCATWL